MIDLTKALFFDIETHRVVNWGDQPRLIQEAFVNHYWDSEKYYSTADHFNELAGLHAEFSRVICVVFGFEDPRTGEFKTTKISGLDEKEILRSCTKIFTGLSSSGYYLAGHNIKGYDIPYLTKRYILNRMSVPAYINTYGEKPWEGQHLDTMQFWKFGSWGNVSLELVTAAMGIECKTDELGGSNLHEYDIADMPWELLEHYCEEDVISNYKMMKTALQFYRT